VTNFGGSIVGLLSRVTTSFRFHEFADVAWHPLRLWQRSIPTMLVPGSRASRNGPLGRKTRVDSIFPQAVAVISIQWNGDYTSKWMSYRRQVA
jgi:hypothetical protein